MEQILRTLASFGLSQADARVYIFLAKKGPHTQEDLCNSLRIPEDRLHHCLKELETKGIITVSSENLLLFYALPFEKVLDLLLKTKLEEIRRTQQDAEEAISDWRSQTKKKPQMS